MQKSPSAAICILNLTSCAGGDTIYLRPCKLTISSYLFPRWHQFLHVGYLRHQQEVDLWPFDLESGVRVTCDVGYLCANFSLHRPLCSRLRPDVCNRQTLDVRQPSDAHHRLMPLTIGAGHNKKLSCRWQTARCIFATYIFQITMPFYETLDSECL